MLRSGGIVLKRFGSGGMPRFQFPADRYGADELGKFLSFSAVGCLIVAVLGSGKLKAVFAVCSMGFLVWCYSRIFSRNFTRRREENVKYLRRKTAVLDWLCLKRDCFSQRKDYAIFRSGLPDGMPEGLRAVPCLIFEKKAVLFGVQSLPCLRWYRSHRIFSGR